MSPDGLSTRDIKNKDYRYHDLGLCSVSKATGEQSLNQVLFVNQQNEALLKALIFWTREL